jgi:hypothetical protein
MDHKHSRSDHESNAHAHHEQLHHIHSVRGEHVHHTTTYSNRKHFRLAISATLHCLLGCGIGEVIGVIIGTSLHWSNLATMSLAVSLGFIMGFLLGILPLLRSGIPLRKAFKIVLIAEGLSILVMETAEVLVEVYTPGVMQAGLHDGMFWMGMGLALIAGFLAAFPVNYFLIGRGVSHQH